MEVVGCFSVPLVSIQPNLQYNTHEMDYIELFQGQLSNCQALENEKGMSKGKTLAQALEKERKKLPLNEIRVCILYCSSPCVRTRPLLYKWVGVWLNRAPRNVVGGEPITSQSARLAWEVSHVRYPMPRSSVTVFTFRATVLRCPIELAAERQFSYGSQWSLAGNKFGYFILFYNWYSSYLNFLGS